MNDAVSNDNRLTKCFDLTCKSMSNLAIDVLQNVNGQIHPIGLFRKSGFQPSLK